MFNKNACLLFSYTCFNSKRIQIHVINSTYLRFKCVIKSCCIFVLSEQGDVRKGRGGWDGKGVDGVS